MQQLEKVKWLFIFLLIVLILPYCTLDLRLNVFAGDTFAVWTNRSTVGFLSLIRLMESPGSSATPLLHAVILQPVI